MSNIFHPLPSPVRAKALRRYALLSSRSPLRRLAQRDPSVNDRQSGSEKGWGRKKTPACSTGPKTVSRPVSPPHDRLTGMPSASRFPKRPSRGREKPIPCISGDFPHSRKREGKPLCAISCDDDSSARRKGVCVLASPVRFCCPGLFKLRVKSWPLTVARMSPTLDVGRYSIRNGRLSSCFTCQRVRYSSTSRYSTF
jgi:hypothetical protein